MIPPVRSIVLPMATYADASRPSMRHSPGRETRAAAHRRTRRPENAPNSASSSATHETAATGMKSSVKIASIGVAMRT